MDDIEAFELSSVALLQDLTQALHFEWHAKFAAANDQKEFFDEWDMQGNQAIQPAQLCMLSPRQVIWVYVRLIFDLFFTFVFAKVGIICTDLEKLFGFLDWGKFSGKKWC